MSKSLSQQQNNSLVDLFERIKDLLIDGRMDIVENVAKRPDLNPKLQTCCTALANLLTRKNEEIEETAMVNRFLRDSINKIIGGEAINEDTLKTEYNYVGEATLDLILELVLYIKSLENRIKEVEADITQVQNEKEVTISSMKEQKESFEREKMAQEEEKSRVIESMAEQINSNEQKLKEFRDAYAMKEEETAELHKIIEEKEEACVKYLQKIEEMKKQKQNVQKLLEEQRLGISISMSQVEEKKMDREEIPSNQNSRLSENDTSFKKQKTTNILHQSMVSPSPNNSRFGMPKALISAIQQNVGKRINSMDKLYNFKTDKKKQPIYKGMQNILLLCQTDEGEICGGFTSDKFSLDDKEYIDSRQETSKAFLFGSKDQMISVNKIKKGRVSAKYDPSFIIFGIDDICISREDNKLTSQPASQDKRCYERAEGDDYFDDIVRDTGNNGVLLKNYEIFQVHFKQ